jgi:hypothetical protein
MIPPRDVRRWNLARVFWAVSRWLLAVTNEIKLNSRR